MLVLVNIIFSAMSHVLTMFDDVSDHVYMMTTEIWCHNVALTSDMVLPRYQHNYATYHQHITSINKPFSHLLSRLL